MVPPLDVTAVRAGFPILAREAHPGVPLTFLDSAASSQKPQAVIDAVSHYYAHQHANVHRGVHALSEEATVAYEEARRKVQRFINARHEHEAIFTRGTTESLNLLAYSWGRANLGPGDVIILSALEHHANIVPWQLIQAERGFSIRYIPITAELTFDMAAFHSFLAEGRVKLVSVAAVSNVLGYLSPLPEIVSAAHAAGALVSVDGAQSVPHMPVDVQALGIDFLAFSGHKMCGPTGIGVLYGREALLEAMPPFMGGGDMIRKVTLEGTTFNDLPYKFEAGTPAIAQAVGLGAAVDYLSGLGMEAIHHHEHEIVEYAHERLSEVPGLRLLSPPKGQRGSVATFMLQGAHPHDIAQLLDEKGIAVRAGHHCAQPLHQHLGLPATTRASFYLYNTHAEADALAEALYPIARMFARS